MEDKKALEHILKMKRSTDNDNILYKEKIKQHLINNPYIIHYLNVDNEIDEDEPDAFYGKYILPFYMVHDVQTKVSNYICFDTSFDEVPRYNDTLKLQEIYFYILCHNKNAIDPKSGIARHDLLAALITEEFNWTNIFGTHVRLISDRPGEVDNDWMVRTLVFQNYTTNGIAKDGRVVK